MRTPSPGFTTVEASAADPAKLQELRENHRRVVTEQQALYNELDGIARASGCGWSARPTRVPCSPSNRTDPQCATSKSVLRSVTPCR